MSIRSLERIARIDSRTQLAQFRERVSATYIDGNMTTVEFAEYRRYLARVGASLTPAR